MANAAASSPFWRTAAGSTSRPRSGRLTSATCPRISTARSGGKAVERPEPLVLPHAMVQEIVAHARQEIPNECCGVIAGSNGRAVKLIRAENAEHSPYRY